MAKLLKLMLRNHLIVSLMIIPLLSVLAMITFWKLLLWNQLTRFPMRIFLLSVLVMIKPWKIAAMETFNCISDGNFSSVRFFEH